jgi:hypothetical protein
VQILPRIIKVAVPSPQHSPILGQLPDEQIVFKLYLSTNDLSSVYFFPVGSFTRIHLGFLAIFGSTVDKSVGITSNMISDSNVQTID